MSGESFGLKPIAFKELWTLVLEQFMGTQPFRIFLELLCRALAFVIANRRGTKKVLILIRPSKAATEVLMDLTRQSKQKNTHAGETKDRETSPEQAHSSDQGTA